MITPQPQIDTRPVKIDWYWDPRKPNKDDGTLAQIYPHFIINEDRYIWETLEW